jgi:hypothetical protein
MSDVTLQINLSPGDSAYAELTVPRLFAAHPDVAERLLVVDLCKPQATGIVDPVKRFPEPAYSHRVQRVSTLAKGWLEDGLVDRVVWLRAGDPLFTSLSRIYLRPWVTATHDYGGCALMSYLAAFELCQTRFLLHYDADLMLYQAPGFDWSTCAREAMLNDEAIIAAVPRPSPGGFGPVDSPSRSEHLSLRSHTAGWLNQWFSTRCYLFDVARLRPLLPLLQGRIYWEVLAARLFRRGYPRSPEIMLYRRMTAAHRWRLMLSDPRAWLLHPIQKDATFIAALPRLLETVAAGHCPDPQRGHQDLRLEEWKSLLA